MNNLNRTDPRWWIEAKSDTAIEKGWSRMNKETAYITQMSTSKLSVFKASPIGKSGYMVFNDMNELLKSLKVTPVDPASHSEEIMKVINS